MLFEAVWLDGPVVFEQGEVGLLEAVDGMALLVGDDDVDDGKRDAGLDGVLGLAGGRRAIGLDGILRGILRGVLRLGGGRGKQGKGDCGGGKSGSGVKPEVGWICWHGGYYPCPAIYYLRTRNYHGELKSRKMEMG
jgi:hypothetical protein